MDPEKAIVTLEFLKDRRAGLEETRKNLLAQLHAVMGGIAEYDWLEEQMQAAASAAAAAPQPEHPSEQATQEAPFATPQE